MQEKPKNPFFGLTAMLSLLVNSIKDSSISHYLQTAWREAQSNIEFRQLFNVIGFAIGDVANRQHNIFGTKEMPGGGNSKSDRWIEYLTFVLTNVPAQFIAFIPLFVEFVGLRELITYQIRTKKHSKNITGTWGLLKLIMNSDIVYKAFLEYLAQKISEGTPFEKWLIAKFLHTPSFKQRKKVDRKNPDNISKRPLQTQTKDKMNILNKLCLDLSGIMGWEVIRKDNFVIFAGLKKWKQQYNGDLAVVLFSQKKILDFNVSDFSKWYNCRAGGERRMVRRWVMDKDNKVKDPAYNEIAKWILNWEAMKENKQQEARNLTEKERTIGLTEDEKFRKEKVVRQAKVTTGAATLFSELESILNGQNVDVTLMESIFNKIKFDVMVRTAVDFSGSMSGKPLQIAALAATAAVMKQNDDAYDLIMGFASTYKVWSNQIPAEVSVNPYMRGSATTKMKLIDRKDSFYDNYKRVLGALQQGQPQSTDPVQIAKAFKNWCDEARTDPTERARRVEEIKSCPVLLIISDGDFNCEDSPSSSMAKLQMHLKEWFDYEPLFVIWNIPRYGEGSDTSKKFIYLKNVISLNTFNPTTINNIFSKITSMEVADSFIELKTLFLNERYDLVKQATI